MSDRHNITMKFLVSTLVNFSEIKNGFLYSNKYIILCASCCKTCSENESIRMDYFYKISIYVLVLTCTRKFPVSICQESGKLHFQHYTLHIL